MNDTHNGMSTTGASKPLSTLPGGSPISTPNFDEWVMRDFAFHFSNMRQMASIFEKVNLSIENVRDYRIRKGCIGEVKTLLYMARIAARRGDKAGFERDFEKAKDFIKCIVARDSVEIVIDGGYTKNVWEMIARGAKWRMPKSSHVYDVAFEFDVQKINPDYPASLLNDFKKFYAGFFDPSVEDDYRERLYATWSQEDERRKRIKAKRDSLCQSTKALRKQIKDSGVPKVTGTFQKNTIALIDELLCLFEDLYDT